MASPLLLDMSFSSSFGTSWIVRHSGRPKAFTSERRNEELKRQQKIAVSVTNEAITHSQKVEGYKLPPLVSALKASAEENAATFQFPGHNRGHAAPSSLTHVIGEKPFLHDLTELPELGNLFAPEGAILEAQEKAAELFGASETWFLVGGSTCGILAAIMATCSPGDILILPRNAHVSTISAMVLSGALPKYIIPHYDFNWDISAGVTPSQVERAIKELEAEDKKPAAVFVVSPTYHGICCDLATISQICHSKNIPLIVDEAHGAHFGFHQQLPSSALFQGADLSIQSTHKVLCSLQQSSMLHMSGNLVDKYRLCRCLQTLQSSSPSYLLLASLDAARAQLDDSAETIFSRAIGLAVEARNLMDKIPKITVLKIADFSCFPAIDPLRITIGTTQLGLSGFEANDILSKNFGVVAELVGTESITLIFNLGTQKEHVLRLISGLKQLSATLAPNTCTKDHGNVSENLAPFKNISMSLSPRDAFFARKTRVSIEDSVGQICGELVYPYPPGVPVLMPGEIITEDALEYVLRIKRKGAVIWASDHLFSSLLVSIP